MVLFGEICKHHSKRFQIDWFAAQPDEILRNSRSWADFLADMRAFYKPTDNLTLKNFKIRDLHLNLQENFTLFALRA